MKVIGRSPGLIFLCIFPLLLILLMLSVFSRVSDYFLLRSGFDFGIYFPLVAITLASSVPVFPGLVYASIQGNPLNIPGSEDNSDKESLNKYLILTRVISSFLLSLFLVLLFIIFTAPVQSEGWLRSLFIALLLSVQSTFVFLLVSCFSDGKFGRLAGVLLYIILLAAVPPGLMFHHPWNHLFFFSPLYWIAWSWVIGQPGESLLYGAISFFITAGSLMLFCRHLYKRLVD